jgi:hypothetical protein
VRLELVEITGALDQLSRDLPLLSRSMKGDLVAVSDRIRECAQLLGAELDRPGHDRRFVRRAVGLSAAAAVGAVGFCGNVLAGEVSERIDLRSPITIVQDRSDEISRIDASLDHGHADDWEVIDGDTREWQQVIAAISPADLLRYDVSRFEPDGLVVRLHWEKNQGAEGSEIALSYAGPMTDGPDDGMAEEALLASLDVVVVDEDLERQAALAVHLLKRYP